MPLGRFNLDNNPIGGDPQRSLDPIRTNFEKIKGWMETVEQRLSLLVTQTAVVVDTPAGPVVTSADPQPTISAAGDPDFLVKFASNGLGGVLLVNSALRQDSSSLHVASTVDFSLPDDSSLYWASSVASLAAARSAGLTWNSSAGRLEISTTTTPRFIITTAGLVGIDELTPAGQLHVTTPDPTRVASVTESAPLQTANISEWRSSASGVLGFIDASGSYGFTENGSGVQFNATAGITIDTFGGVRAPGVNMRNTTGQQWGVGLVTDQDVFTIAKLGVLDVFQLTTNAGSTTGVRATAHLRGANASDPGLRIQSVASPTQDLTQWCDSLGTVVTRVSKNLAFGVDIDPDTVGVGLALNSNAYITLGHKWIWGPVSGIGAKDSIQSFNPPPGVDYVLPSAAPAINGAILASTIAGQWSWLSILPPTQGGTGFGAFTVGDILYANTTTTLALLPIGAAGTMLQSTGTLPAWAAGSGSSSAGPMGMPGLAGEDGEMGWPGPPGLAGAAGVVGTAGPMGTPGLSGIDGEDGFPGPPGASGAAGSTGATGVAGADGRPGVDGLDGLDGDPGVPGAPGVPGIPGLMGIPGFDGVDGLDGFPGPTGATGAAGTAGAAGGAGPMGPPGPASDDADSSWWPQPPGLGGTVTGLGTTNTLSLWLDGPHSILGDSAIIDDGSVVSANARHFSIISGLSPSEFRIYQASGIGSNYAGFVAGSLASSTIYTLPIAFPAASGYVLASTVGGVTSWIAPSTGPMGPQGIPGIDGEDGAMGMPGVPGAAGSTGAAGAAGSIGSPGYDGLDGDMGWPGVAGPPGPQGPIGFGIPGLDGMDGGEWPQGLTTGITLQGAGTTNSVAIWTSPTTLGIGTAVDDPVNNIFSVGRDIYLNGLTFGILWPSKNDGLKRVRLVASKSATVAADFTLTWFPNLPGSGAKFMLVDDTGQMSLTSGTNNHVPVLDADTGLVDSPWSRTNSGVGLLDLSPDTDIVSNLGAEDLRWARVYTPVIDSGPYATGSGFAIFTGDGGTVISRLSIGESAVPLAPVDVVWNLIATMNFNGAALVEILSTKYEDGSFSTTLSQNAAATASASYKFPLAPPVSNGQFLTSTIAGQWSWSSGVGPQGIPGPPGEDGADGAIGPPGTIGQMGLQGFIGPPGVDGEDASYLPQGQSTRTIPSAEGGTGFSTGVLGDTLYHDGTNWVKLAGNTTVASMYLSQQGDGLGSSAPSFWQAIPAVDIPALNASKITAGTLAVARGGTNLGSGTSGGILGFTGTGTLASSALLTNNSFMLGGGAGATPKVSTNLTESGTVVSNAGDEKLTTVGKGFYIKEGSNATMGVATLVIGVATVSTTKVTASSRIFLSVESLGTVTVPTTVAVTARTAGTSFVITSSNAVDTSVVAWLIMEPA